MATSFASVSVAKQLCRIVRAVAATAALPLLLVVITTTAWSTPHHRLRRSLSSRRSLLVAALANWRQSLRSVSALNFHLRGSRQRSWMPGLAKPDQGGKQEANGGKLAFIRAVQAFSCHGGRQCRLPVLFKQLSRHTQPSLILSWAPRKNRTPYSKYRPAPYSSSRGTDASCTCVSFSATPRNSSFTSESSSGSAIVSDWVRLPPRMRVMSVSG